MYRHWRLKILGLLVVALVLALQVFDIRATVGITALSRIEAVWYDLRFQLWPPQRAALAPIVIVDLDEATQQREGRWPWDRSKVAQLIRALQERGTALIGLDIVFSEPGVNPTHALLASAQLPPAARQTLSELADAFDGDAILAKQLNAHTVLGYFFHEDGGKSGVLPPPFLALTDEQVAASSLIALPDYTANLALLTEHAWHSGFVVAVPDIDGIVRRVPLVLRHENGVYASLSLEMARLALGAPWIRLEQAQRGKDVVVTAAQVGRHLRIPLDAQGNMLVPYRGRAGSYPTISATGVLRGDAPKAQLAALEGAIVLVGTSALGLADLRTTPLQTGYPGVEVHANILDAMLQAAKPDIRQGETAPSSGASLAISDASPFYQRPDWEPGATLALLLLTGLILTFMLPGRSPLVMLLLSSAWLLLTVGLNIVLWRYWHLAMPMALQTALVIGLGTLNISGGYISSNRQRRAIQNLFGEYVPADHVTRLLGNPGKISMDGEQRNMTVLFADVRNFTALSESLSATELKSVLNRYLSAITAVIFEHHGTIDKYVGDLVMAFWNAPLDDPEHARHAVQAALAMQTRMAFLRESFAQEGLPIFHIGIGINTGPMNVGDMGSTYRKAYTVLGDAVNLASRLEGLTDFYGTPILVSDSTRSAAPDFIYRTVDLVRVKGRRQSLVISQPMAPSTHAAPHALVQADRLEQGIALYQARRWDEARAIFGDLAAAHPGDPLYQLYLNRLAAPAPDALDMQWQAIHEHDTK